MVSLSNYRGQSLFESLSRFFDLKALSRKVIDQALQSNTMGDKERRRVPHA